MSGPRVLYVSGNGVREPLVESQVLAYLRRLRPGLGHVRLVTFERAAISAEERRSLTKSLAADGIEWTPLRSHPKLGPANLPSVIARGTRLVRSLHRRERYDLAHARSFPPAVIAGNLRSSHGVPMLYDLRGFWILEKRAKGSLKNAWLFGKLSSLERSLYERADHLVSLTRAGERRLREWGVSTGVSVIPCCVDVERFAVTPRTGGPLRLISVGSLGPGYLPEAVFGAYRAALRIDEHATLDVVTRDEPDVVLNKAGDVPTANVRVRALPPSEVPAAIAAADVGLCMIEPSEAKVASSPTKLAEYLACGRPVVASRGCGDVAEDLTRHDVGTLVEPDDRTGDFPAVSRAVKMLSDDGLADRCRAAAVAEFSVDVGVERYRRAYEQTLAAGAAGLTKESA